MNTPTNSEALPPTTGSGSLLVVDLDSPFFWGVAREMTPEERKKAEAHGRYDNPPMSVLGVTSDGLAAVEGKDMAQLFATSPKLLDALRNLLPIAVDLIDKANERGEIEWPSGNISEVIHAQAAINEALCQNS